MSRRRNRSVAGVLGWVGAIALVLFTAISMISFLFGRGTPRTNYGGIVGSYLASGLFYLLGGMSVMVPALAGTVIFIALTRRQTEHWRRFCSFGLLFLVVLVGAGLLSFYSGMRSPQDNFGGLFGSFVSTVLTGTIGLGALSLVALGFYFGFVMWWRRLSRRDIFWTVVILIGGLFLALFLGYFHTGRHLAGSVGYGVIGFLNGLIGSVGTLIFLITGVVALLVVAGVTPFFRPAVRAVAVLLKRIVSRPRAERAVKIQVTPAGVNTAVPKGVESEAMVTATGPEPAPVETRVPVLTADEGAQTETTGPEKGAALRPLRPKRSPKPDFVRFQTEFLERLDQPVATDRVFKDPAEAEAEGQVLMNKLKEFGVDGRLTAILSGPMITRFELEPAPGVRCSGIESLADDIALALSAERVRILAPIPGKSAVGVEIPNKSRRTVFLKEVLVSDTFRQIDSPLGFALGTTITGEPFCADLRQMPHILIAGTTGSGKSVCINSIIMSIIYRSTPDEVRLLTIDPKQLELPIYDPIPHLLSRTTINPELVIGELTRIVNIMEARYSEFAELGVRDITSFNACCEEAGKQKKPYIVVVVDELADLMQRAPAEIEARIIRLAQMSRAVGIHLILATQRPSVDVITGLIKANFPCRIAFQVATKVDSRTILDANGAESLLGRGDMLFMPPGKGEPIRLHGCFVSERATKRCVALWAGRYLTELLDGLVEDPAAMAAAVVQQDLMDVLYDPRRAARGKKLEQLQALLSPAVVNSLMSRRYYEPLVEEAELKEMGASGEGAGSGETDPLFVEAARLVVLHREASVSMLQRRLDVGWARAGRIIDQLERAGIVGPHAGSKPRKVLVEDEGELAKKLEGLQHNDKS